MNIITKKTMFGFAAALVLLLGGPSAQAEIKHRYSFTDSAADSVSGADGEVVNNTGNAAFSDGQLVLGNTGQASNSDAGDYVDLPNGILTDLVDNSGEANFTMEVWFTWNGAGDWQRIWDIGRSVGGEDVSDSGDLTAQFFTTPQAGGGGVRAAWRGEGGGEASVTRQPSATSGEEHHLAFVWDEANTTATMYYDGVNSGENTATAITIANDIAGNDVNNWLGRSQWGGDVLFVGSYNEFRIYDHALSADEVASNFFGGADSTTGGSLDDLGSLDLSIGNTSLVQGEVTVASAMGAFGGRSLNVTPFAEVSSSNTSVATVDASGNVTAVGSGSTLIKASLGGKSASVEVTVAVPPLPEAVLKHRYTFSDAAGSNVLKDSVGDKNGEAINVSFNGDGTADLQAENLAFVDLPNGMISGLGDNGSVEVWATFDSAGQGNWQRVFDFGNTTLGEDPVPPQDGGDAYNGEATWFYAPRRGAITGGDGGRAAFDPGVSGGENPTVDPGDGYGVPTDQEFHLVVNYNHTHRNMEIWIDGINVATAPVLADRPLSSLDDVNNWIGRSQWGGDAFATANYNEFRIYEGVLDPVQIAVNTVTGPDEIIEDPGAATNLSLQISESNLVEGGLTANLSLVVDFENVAGVDLSSSTLAQFSSSDTSVARIITSPLRVVPVGAGSASLTVEMDGVQKSVNVTVASAGAAPTLAHRYQFDGNANDSVGDKDGSLIGEGSYEAGSLVLGGAGFVDLPDYLLSEFFMNGQNAVTFEIYGRWEGGSAWQRLVDIGDNTYGEEFPIPAGVSYNGTSYMQITPSSGGGTLFGEVVNTEVVPAQYNPGIHGPGLTAGQDFYVAFVLDTVNGVARLYRNGELVGVQAINEENDFSLIPDYNVWLGRSNFSADANYNGSFSEVRVWEGALQEADILLHAACGPDELSCEPPVTIPDGAVIAINFAADEPAGARSDVAGAAGVQGTVNWNNVDGAAGEAGGLTADVAGSGLATGVSVAWSSPNTWSSAGRGEENNTGEGNNGNLMTGYIDTNSTDPNSVTVSGLPADGSYDVIVYMKGGVIGRGGDYAIGGQVIAHLDTAAFDGNFVAGGEGDYIVFKGVSGESFTLTGTPTNVRAPINGLEVIIGGGFEIPVVELPWVYVDVADPLNSGGINTYSAVDGAPNSWGMGGDGDAGWRFRDTGPGAPAYNNTAYTGRAPNEDPALYTIAGGLKANAGYKVRVYGVYPSNPSSRFGAEFSVNGGSSWTLVDNKDWNLLTWVDNASELGTALDPQQPDGDTRFYTELPGVLVADGSGNARVDLRLPASISDGSAQDKFNIDGYAFQETDEVPSVSGGITGISIQDGNVVIEFTGTLKSAASVTGPYSSVAGAASPYTVAPAQAAEFFIAD
jgi:hypothetical protein